MQIDKTIAYGFRTQYKNLKWLSNYEVTAFNLTSTGIINNIEKNIYPRAKTNYGCDEVDIVDRAMRGKNATRKYKTF